MKLQDLLEAPAYSMQRFIQNIVNTDSEHLLRNMDMYKDGTMLIRVAYLRELIGRGLIDSPEIVENLKLLDILKMIY
jgi:hypothetical protein